MNRSLKKLFIFFACCSLVLLGAFVHLNLSEGKIFNSIYNQRLWSAPRGKIVDRYGFVLASGQGEARVPTLGSAAAQVVGYAHPTAGVGGEIEMKHGDLLTAAKGRSKFFYFVSADEITESELVTTLDSRMQVIADQALGNYKGAIVILKAATGEILAEVSHPSFDPRHVKENWKELNSRSDAPLYNRATQGKYPPGSVWKTITAMLLLGKDDPTYECNGSVLVAGREIKCSHTHGNLNGGGLKDYYAKSCNAYFSSRGINEIPQRDFIKASSMFTSVKLPKKMGAREYALSILGQGPILISAMDGAKMTAAIISEGRMPQPTLIIGEKTSFRQVMDRKTADALKELMVEVVRNGTGSQLGSFLEKGVLGIKTGTAQKTTIGGKGSTNIAWEVGFASRGIPNDDIAFAFVAEDVPSSSYASEVISPIVAKILDHYYSSKR